MIKIAIVDDHPLVIDGLRSIVDPIQDIDVVGEAIDGIDLVDLLSKKEVDVILMDISMPVMDGIEATTMVKERYPNTKVLILSMHDQLEHTKKAMNAGADGFLLKNSKGEEIEEAIRTLMQGENFFSQKIMSNAMKAMKSENSREEVKLTERELDVLKLIVQECTTKEIAEKLFISTHTVESHRKNLLFKLDVKGIAGLVKYALENKLIK